MTASWVSKAAACPACAGTNIGGGTFWGLCRLLTGLKDFDEILALSSGGDNSKVRCCCCCCAAAVLCCAVLSQALHCTPKAVGSSGRLREYAAAQGEEGQASRWPADALTRRPPSPLPPPAGCQVDMLLFDI